MEFDFPQLRSKKYGFAEALRDMEAEIRDVSALIEYYRLHPNEADRESLRRLRGTLSELEGNIGALYFVNNMMGRNLEHPKQ